MNLTTQQSFKRFALGAGLIATLAVVAPRPAQADTQSTAFIIAGAAAIVGALLIDSNNRPYYVRDDHRYYVTPDEARYYRNHYHVVQRQSWVRENEYPISRSEQYRMQQQRTSRMHHDHDQYRGH